MSLDEAKSSGIDISQLDEQYPAATSFNPKEGVFRDDQSEFLIEYQKLLRKIGIDLYRAGIEWGENTMFVHRIYFSEDGSVGYFLFGTSSEEIDNDIIRDYLIELSREYSFPIESETKFRQCATAPMRVGI
ncbi:hypothetical protein [Rhodohalobacter halophilus]|uniref:hypothetical protein n=1 Tax=Rhodohalobacter halophilus TaxID=1812810 RepID=UPI00083FBEB7|nr:hypothetical protein [Rhodohalobacter halophilus]